MDGVTPYDDLYAVASLLQTIGSGTDSGPARYDELRARLARLHNVIKESGLVQVGWASGPIIAFERYTHTLIARLVPILPGTKLPATYPDSPSHSVNPDVPIVSLADLDATEVA